MSGKISRVEHRHGDQKKSDANLVLEVGKTLPAFYQAGRRRGCIVRSIRDGNPVTCDLGDDDFILIGRSQVINMS